jgi:hypothetical protein
MMRAVANLFTVILLTSLVTVTASPETDYIDGQIAGIRTNFNVEIHYQYTPELFFPTNWLHPVLALSASEIEVAEVTRLLPVIQQFLNAHPAPVVRSDLEHIYLLKELSFRGKPYGSTHRAKSMYIICAGEEKRYSDEFMACRLHSEFSSILLEHHVFPSDSWNEINPAGFFYSGTGFEVVDNPSCYDSTERSCSDGFVVNYCRSSLENDFNMLSSWLFTKKDDLDTLSQQHDRLRQKQILAEQFYTSLNGQYTFD